MLKDELMKIDCGMDVPFENGGIILYSPDSQVFFKIAFGDGTNSDSLEDDCDDYVYVQKDRYNDDGDFDEDIDGGQMDICRKDYTGYINDEKLIRDCFKFMDYDDVFIDRLILIRKFNH